MSTFYVIWMKRKETFIQTGHYILTCAINTTAEVDFSCYTGSEEEELLQRMEAKTCNRHGC